MGCRGAFSGRGGFAIVDMAFCSRSGIRPAPMRIRRHLPVALAQLAGDLSTRRSRSPEALDRRSGEVGTWYNATGAMTERRDDLVDDVGEGGGDGDPDPRLLPIEGHRRRETGLCAAARWPARPLHRL